MSRVRIRPTPLQTVGAVLVWLVLAALSYVFLGDLPTWWILILIAVVFLARDLFGVLLTPETVRYLAVLRVHRVPWSHIKSVDDRPTLLSRTVQLRFGVGVAVPSTPRRGWLLRDRAYQAKVETIQRWWGEHRGAPPER